MARFQEYRHPELRAMGAPRDPLLDDMDRAKVRGFLASLAAQGVPLPEAHRRARETLGELAWTAYRRPNPHYPAASEQG